MYLASIVCFAILAHDAQRENVDHQGDEEQHHAESKGCQSLGVVKGRVADQQGHDLNRDGRDAVQWVDRHLCNQTRRHDNDHRFANRPTDS